MNLQKAQRKQTMLRLNLSAPSGAGKTYSALLLAKGLVGNWEDIAVLDTENGSASLYSHLGEFNTIQLEPPFTPERYIQAIDVVIQAGIKCIIIDSSTHEWSGSGGCLEINDKLAQLKYKGNTWAAWSETTPRHDAFVSKVLHAPLHVITCTRSKMETVMGEGKKVHKVGMKDIQRDGWEYELTVSLTIDRDTHLAVASKDRTNLFEGKDAFVINEKTGKTIKDWCETGVIDAAPKPMESVGQHQVINGSIYDIAADTWKTKRILTDDQFQSAIAKIQDGECIKGSTVTVYDWVKTECQLTEAQQNTFNLLNTQDNGTD